MCWIFGVSGCRDAAGQIRDKCHAVFVRRKDSAIVIEINRCLALVLPAFPCNERRHWGGTQSRRDG